MKVFIKKAKKRKNMRRVEKRATKTACDGDKIKKYSLAIIEKFLCAPAEHYSF